MRIVQFEIPGSGRRVGVVQGEVVRDITSVRPELTHVVEAARTAHRENCLLAELLSELAAGQAATEWNYGELLGARPGAGQPFLQPPVDDPDPHRVLVTGTGLTHTGSMQSRNEMHGGAAAEDETPRSEPETDSARMFQIGLEGGRPAPGQRGASPEWFYKGNGEILRGPNSPLELPAFALDGGEEPELVGCYLIDFAGQPRRLGYALGNEWSDHATERINYLYLAPSKLRTCAVGPELITGFEFDSLELRCVVEREGATVYDSGPLKTGQQFMSHSLANCEDHHFKYPQHRQPGDVHLHFFGTSQLSFSTRSWKFADGDVVRIESPGFSAPLVNPVVAGDPALAAPVEIQPG
ncbi:MAG: sugar transporter [Planctomycetaceae bacterium]|nr:sugar transporter [Planctomycetaceae bacterium]